MKKLNKTDMGYQEIEIIEFGRENKITIIKK